MTEQVGDPVGMDAGDLVTHVAAVLRGAGVPRHDAGTVAASLVRADMEGVASHGVALVSMYVDRILAGSVDPTARPEVVVEDRGGVVIDAHHCLGQVSGEAAMGRAIAKAREHGLGLVTVRHGFHFGMARPYALMAADQGCVGIVSCNTRPLMPAPGGGERLVGNNPIAIALPGDGPVPVVLDIALSEGAMGRVRMAEATGRAIPESWATDGEGRPTTDPSEAIDGMLLPVGGHKGFGLAFMLDVLAGALSGGAWGEGVRPLYGDPAVPYDSSHLFCAIDVSCFRPLADFRSEVEAAVRRVATSAPAPGAERPHSPGQGGWERRREAAGRVTLDPAVVDALRQSASRVGVSLDDTVSERSTDAQT